MSEAITLTSPLVTTVETIALKSLHIDREEKRVEIHWREVGGAVRQATYDDSTSPTGAQLLTALNTANLTSNSLIKRTLARLQADGHIGAGAITGTPE